MITYTRGLTLKTQQIITKKNTFYDIRILRAGGRLKCWANGILVYDQANTTSLTSKPNLRL